MKTLYVTENYEYVQPRLIAALREAGADAEAFYYTLKPVRPGALSEQARAALRFQSPISGKGPLLYLTRLRLAARACLKQCREAPPDVLHGNMLFADGFICRSVGRRLGIPYIVSVRNTDLNLGFLWKLPWIRRMGMNNLRQARRVLFLSPAYRDRLLARLPAALAGQVKEKSAIVPNGIDGYYLEHLHAHGPRPHDPVRLSFVGKINALKNLEEVLAAMDLLRGRGVRTELTVVGPIADESCRPLVTGREDVRYLGKQPKEAVCEAYRQADLFVMPSHTESFGLVYAEAMSQGLPVIYTRGQGFDGQFPDGEVGYAVSDRDPEELAEKIERSLERYAELSARCTENAKRFDWRDVSRTLLERCYR